MGGMGDGPLPSDCEHNNTDELYIGLGYPRCLSCGDIFDGLTWINSALLVAVLFSQGDDKTAKELMEYMRIGREELGLPYPDNSEEKYLEIAEVMRQQTTNS